MLDELPDPLIVEVIPPSFKLVSAAVVEKISWARVVSNEVRDLSEGALSSECPCVVFVFFFVFSSRFSFFENSGTSTDSKAKLYIETLIYVVLLDCVLPT